jgi:hypothetical protein
MPGPAPLPASRRQRRNRVATAATIEAPVALRVDLRAIDIGTPWHPRVLATWDAWWASPIATEWVDAFVPGLIELARLVQDYWTATGAGERSKVRAEIRMSSREYGLSPLSLRSLQWEIKKAEAPVCAARDRSDAAARPATGGRAMTVLEVPSAERKPWPSLGGEVCQWIEDNLVFGPGDLRGEPYRLDDEKRRLVWRLYELYPRDHPNAGRRRFRRAALSMRKGTAKTEFGAAIAAVELAPDGPVRCDGWKRVGREWIPVGRPMRDPYIPMLAYTEEQSEELAYSALTVMIGEGPRAFQFDIGADRVMRVTGDGKAAALANAPDARDGARTTFELFDETHRLRLPNQLRAHRTMLANLPKRKQADAWALEVTTAPAPGEGSVAELTMDYARSSRMGRAPTRGCSSSTARHPRATTSRRAKASAQRSSRRRARSPSGPTSTESPSSGTTRPRTARTWRACG